MDYRIVCTEQEPRHYPTHHAHIVAVGTGDDPNKANKRWALEEVIEAINRGWHSFYTQGVSSGKIARVIVVDCLQCGNSIIRSTGDAVTDNNLDSLRICNFN